MNGIILPLHLLILMFLFFTIIRADHYGFSWIREKVETLDKNKLQKFHKYIWLGLCGMIITGLFLFWPMREFLLTRPQFYIKMGFVLALVINSFAIGHLQKIATEKSFASLSTKEKIPLILSGVVSTVSWVMAILTAFFLIPD